MIFAVDYTPPVNHPQVIQVAAPAGYTCEGDAPNAPLRAKPCPPGVLPSSNVTGYVIPADRPQITEGTRVEIGTAIYLTPDGGIVVRRSARWWLT